MKLPTTFLPEKNLDEKVEELKNSQERLKPVSIEDLMKDGMKLLYGDPEKTDDSFLEQAFEKIIEDTFSGKIKWKEIKKYTNRFDYIAEATITNAEGKKITIPALFYTVVNVSRYVEICGAFLHLGDERGPFLSTLHPDVKKLAKKYFKLDF